MDKRAAVGLVSAAVGEAGSACAAWECACESGTKASAEGENAGEVADRAEEEEVGESVDGAREAVGESTRPGMKAAAATDNEDVAVLGADPLLRFVDLLSAAVDLLLASEL